VVVINGVGVGTVLVVVDAVFVVDAIGVFVAAGCALSPQAASNKFPANNTITTSKKHRLRRIYVPISSPIN
jgi:hypothetical protein